METVEEIKRLLEDMQKSEGFKSRKEVVIDAINEMAVRYGFYSKEAARGYFKQENNWENK